MIFIISIFIGSSLYAQAPVMEYFVPTEWKSLNELSENETKSFIENHKQIFEYCEKISFSHLEGRHFPEQNVLIDETKVFKEIVNEDVFYWILVPGNRVNDTKKMMKDISWLSEKHFFLGLVRVENGTDKLLFFHPTLNIDWDEKSNYYFVRTYQIVKGKSKNKGIIYYENRLNFERDNTGTKFNSLKTLKNQPVGHISKASYYLFENEPVESEYVNDIPGFCLKNWNSIKIFASDFLWDLNMPLKYGLQNVFDDNPATSYVENTENDLIRIEFSLGKQIKSLAIINGYAANQELYNSNNSVQEIGIYAYDPIFIDGEKFVEETEKQRINCIANKLNWQIFEVSKFVDVIKVEKYFKGSKYNDTCVSELNLSLQNNRWLFGDINE